MSFEKKIELGVLTVIAVMLVCTFHFIAERESRKACFNYPTTEGCEKYLEKGEN